MGLTVRWAWAGLRPTLGPDLSPGLHSSPTWALGFHVSMTMAWTASSTTHSSINTQKRVLGQKAPLYSIPSSPPFLGPKYPVLRPDVFLVPVAAWAAKATQSPFSIPPNLQNSPEALIMHSYLHCLHSTHFPGLRKHVCKIRFPGKAGRLKGKETV